MKYPLIFRANRFLCKIRNALFNKLWYLHSKYLIVPAVIALIYAYGVLLNPAIVPENIADVVKRVAFVRLPNCIYIMLFNISILTDQLRIIY
jgi:hypothetical protein